MKAMDATQLGLNRLISTILDNKKQQYATLDKFSFA